MPEVEPLSLNPTELPAGHFAVLARGEVAIVIREGKIDLYPGDGWHFQTLRDGVDYPPDLPGPAVRYARRD